MAIVKNIDPVDAVLGDDRQLENHEFKSDFLPYVTCNLEVTVLDCHPKLFKNRNGRDCAGVFLTVRVDKTDVPEVAVGKCYAMAFFSVNPDLHDIVIKRHFEERAACAAAMKGVAFSKDFPVASALRDFHNTSGDLNIPIAVHRISKMSGKGKPYTETSFSSLAAEAA